MSASLSGDLYPSQQAHQYLQILRDFRDGRVGDLAEPWELADSDGDCSIWHSVNGNRITYTRRKPAAPQNPRPEWTQDTANGDTVYRATVPLIDKEKSLHAGTADVAAFGANTDVDDDALLRSLPGPVLRVESRSTQLVSAIQRFRACYAQGQQ